MSDIDFEQALRDAGIPTTEVQLRQAWDKEVQAQGSPLSNTSAWSPFWRLVSALVTKPVFWLINFLSGSVLPNFFLKTAEKAWLDALAWAVNTERKPSTHAQGELLFTRSTPAGEFELAAGTRVQSAAINGHVYELLTAQPTLFADGQGQRSVAVRALEAGSGYNLAPGYYAILPVPVPGIAQVVNTENWLKVPGTDAEPDDELRLRARNQFSAVNQWHTDAVYRALISSFQGVRPDGVYFEHGAPRGPGSANAYVLFEAGVPADEYVARINAHIRDQGNHGHGDDLLVLVIPETHHDVSVRLWPKANLTELERERLKEEVEQFIRAAFRESSRMDFQPTLTYPQARFSFSRLTEELHEQFPRLESLKFANDDILSQLNIPRVRSLEITDA